MVLIIEIRLKVVLEKSEVLRPEQANPSLSMLPTVDRSKIVSRPALSSASSNYTSNSVAVSSNSTAALP